MRATLVFNGLKAERPTMKVTHFRKLAIEFSETLKSLNPDLMQTHFKKGSHFARIKNDVVVYRAKN